MRAWMLWVVWGCNTGKDVAIERDQLKVQVADLAVEESATRARGAGRSTRRCGAWTATSPS